MTSCDQMKGTTMTMTHRDLHAILGSYELPATYQATIETDTGPDPEGAHTMISDLDARRIASDWHGGQGTALYAFASTGAIDTARADHDLLREVNATIKAEHPPVGHDLYILYAYVHNHNARGPQPGWNDLTW
jgi:hypothetical protein